VGLRGPVGGLIGVALILVGGSGTAFADAATPGLRVAPAATSYSEISSPPTPRPSRTANGQASQIFGPASGMHVRVEGTAATGYRAMIYDGNTFVTGRGMVGPWDVTVVPRAKVTRVASCTLGGTNTCTGLAQEGYPGDGVTRPTKIGGLSGRKTVKVVRGDQDMYFDIRAKRASSGSYTATFTIEYYDQGKGSWALEYDSTRPTRGKYRVAGAVERHNTGTWKIVSFSVADARFAHRENGGGDFRIASVSPVVVHRVSVRVTAQPNEVPAHLQNKYTKVTYSSASRTLTLSGATNTVQTTTVSRFESYRFVGNETLAAIVGIRSDEPVTAWYSLYTDFPAHWEPMWAGGYTRHYSSPTTDDNADDSPIPVLGASNGQHVYGVTSGATWDYPLPGYSTPHLVINGNRLAAPQMGTQVNPVQLRPGVLQQWETVFFRSSPLKYDMELGAEVAMATALGFTTGDSPGLTGALPAGRAGPSLAARAGAAADFGLIMRATAYWLREAPGGSGHAVVPSPHYSPSTYMRDSFWTTMALAGTPLFGATEEPIFTAFTRSVPTSGPQAGHVPVALGGALYPDESNLLYLVRLYNDAVVHHLPVKNRSVARLVLHYVETDQVRDGAWLTTAPQKHGRFTISPDTWLDGYRYPLGAVSGYAQGLYVVALEAARKLGLGVGNRAIARADRVYQSLYDPKVGYLRWLSATTYKGPDVLVGDALSLLLFGRPLLPDAEVASTLAHQDWTPYGMAVLATKDNTYLPAHRFETLELNGAGQVIGVGETGGWYQNGGSWFLYSYLAEWAAARQSDAQADPLMARSIDEQVAVTPMSKEFQLTSIRPDYYSYPPGSSNFQRQGYGWNAAYLAFTPTLTSVAGPALSTTVKASPSLPRPLVPAGAYYGPLSAMHVVVTGNASTGLAADIADGHTLVSRRGLVGPADITVLAPSGPVRLSNRYTKASYDRTTATLTLSGATNTVAGTTVTRWESYRLVGREVVEARIGVSAVGGHGHATKLYYSPYTDFPSSWRMLRPVPDDYSLRPWSTGPYSSPPTGGSSATQYGLPLLGAYAGNYIYGVASGDTWQYPIDGYDSPHLTVQGDRLGAPQIGDASHPISVAPGQSRQWMQVFYRSAPTAYEFELAGEVAMARALGYSMRTSPGVSGRLDPTGLPAAPVPDPQAVTGAMLDWGLVLDATAYWALQTTPGGTRTVVPSNAYAPRTFMRDSFWTLLGLGGALGNQAEEYTMRLFSANVAGAGPSAGVVPTSLLPPDHPGYGILASHEPPADVDETNLLYIVRMYYDSKVRHLRGVLNRRDAELALDWVLRHRVSDGHIVQIANTAGSWLDTACAPLGSVNSYSQGLYVVALMAARGLGIEVSDSQIGAAQSAYAALYSPSLGYLPWDSAPGYQYRAPDVLAGEAWSLFLFNSSILPTQLVAGTLRSLATGPYGLEDVAGAARSYLDNTNPKVFRQGIDDLDSPGHYQNGGDWYLFNYWAAYAGERLHVPGSAGLISWDTGRQLAVEPTSHEYLSTYSSALGPGAVADQVPMSAPSNRQGYGWNAAFNAFDPTAGRALVPVKGTSIPAIRSNAIEASTRSPTDTSTVLDVNTTASVGSVNKAVLGHDYEWDFDGLGTFDPITGHFYANFVHQLTDVVQPGSLRYPGGIGSDTFHWDRAIGPETVRTANAYGPYEGPSASAVGPDEFGQLLDDTGATGVITANFGTGTAQEAADFVSYMTGAVGTSQWADLRAKDGHPKPYDVPWWGVGNEANQPSELYWRAGTPVFVGGPPGACQAAVTCLYIYGGSTRFTKEPVVGYADRRPRASFSTGEPGQSFYAAYPPVLKSSATVYVSGTVWREVPSLSTAGPDGHGYVLDPGSGKITFGDGIHGAVPPAGAQVTLSYVSGPHDGFLRFYKAMKAANPSIEVCSSDAGTGFLEAMGSSLPYDCLQDDSYASTSTVGNGVPITTYEREIMVAPQQEARGAAVLSAAAAHYAGRAVPLVEMEYGQLLNSNPMGYPYYHYSLDEALLNAGQVVEWIRLGVPVADRQLVSAEIPTASRCCTKLPGADPYATTGAIGTSGKGTVLEATGELYALFAGLGGGAVLPTVTLHNPVLATVGGQEVGTLLVLAVRKENELYLVGINRSPTDVVHTTLSLEGSTVTKAGVVISLDGASALSHNSLAAPLAVRLTSRELKEAGRELAVTFPAHSVTTLRLPVMSTAA
jgi:alpha-L-arabinofuranosidase